MPRRRGAKKKRKRKDDNKNPRPPKRPRSEEWTPWCTENERFSTYYSEQPFIPPSEFPSFLLSLKTELPTTIRINETGQFKNMVKDKFVYFQESMKDVKYLPTPDAKEEVQVDPPSPISWYPVNGRLSSASPGPSHSAWQFSMARRFLKKSKSVVDLKNFIVLHNSLGTLSRQEAVSMIPTLFMDVLPHHYVLDMCAAPGSKTMQLIEDLHQSSVPEGLIIANDSNPQRCHTLSTQIKRIGTPNVVVTNHRAQFFPALTAGTSRTTPVGSNPPPEGPLLFDRILCDVPCSGDGTLRKNPDIWQKWNPMQGVGLHRIQVSIAWRAFTMLTVGGRMVYSTCSLNPCEDEAVVAHLLLLAKGACTLVDVSHHLPNLIRTPGIHQWRIMDKEANWYDSHDLLPPSLSHVPQSVFPPHPEIAKTLNLERTFRILPHSQDTGGFFVAVLEKTASLPHYRFNYRVKPKQKEPEKFHQSEEDPVIGEKKSDEGGPTDTDLGEKASATATDTTDPVEVDPEDDDDGEWDDDDGGDDGETKEKGNTGNKPKIPPVVNTDEFLPLPADILPRWNLLKEYYGISDSFPFENLHSRVSTSKDGLPQKIYFLTSAVTNLIKNPANKKLKVLNSGVKVFQKMTYDYRPCQEGLAIIFPFVTKRVVPLRRSDLILLLSQKDPPETLFCEDTQLALKSLEAGPCLFSLKDDQCSIDCVGFRGRTFCSLYMRNNEKKVLVQVLCPEANTNIEKVEIKELKMEIQTKSEGDTREEHGKMEIQTKSEGEKCEEHGKMEILTKEEEKGEEKEKSL